MKDTENKSKKVNLHKGHRARVKKLYMSAGAESLPEHVLLELLLFFGIPYKDTNEISHELLERFGGFKGVLDADIESLKSVKNMTENAAILLKLVSDISGSESLVSQPKPQKINTEAKIKSFLLKTYKQEREEKAGVLLIDRFGCVVHFEIISAGNRELSGVAIGKIVKLANARNIKTVALAHNHPDNSKISTNDIVSTKRIAYHLKSVDINLLEHYVVTDGKVVEVFKTINEKH